MDSKKHILFITKHDPYAQGGGPYATRAYMRAFSVVFENRIDICVADSCQPFDNDIGYDCLYRIKERPLYLRLLSFITGEMHRHTSFVKKLLHEHSDKYSLCVFDQNAVAGTLVRYVNQIGIKTVTIHHNHEVEYFKANDNNAIVRKMLLPQIRRIEKIAYKNSQINLFLTAADRDIFKSVYGKASGLNEIIGCFEFTDYQAKKSSSTANKYPVFVITGSLNRLETKEALHFFFSELYDAIPSTSQIIIAGRNPDNELATWCSSHANVRLIPNPENMQDVINQADIYLSPTRSGGGLKLRIMDGVSSGLPVIAHQISARGYDAFIENEVLYTFEEKHSFQAAIEKMLLCYTQGHFSKENIQDVYKKSFSFESGVRRLKEILSKSAD